MRYQVRILGADEKSFFRRKVRSGLIYNFGSSESLEGAIALAQVAPFCTGELVIVEDKKEGRWVLIKRGFVPALRSEAVARNDPQP